MGTRKYAPKYSDEIADRICQIIADGDSADTACRTVGISRMTLYRWRREREDFAAALQEAREDAADTLVDDLMRIADEEEDVQRAKIKIDARKWVAARMKPKSWGDKVQQEVTGVDGGPVQIQMVRYGDDTPTE